MLPTLKYNARFRVQANDIGDLGPDLMLLTQPNTPVGVLPALECRIWPSYLVYTGIWTMYVKQIGTLFRYSSR